MKKAVWIIAHGSKYGDWVRIVDEMVLNVNTNLPIITSFLEEVEGRSIYDGLEILEDKNFTDIFVIPLFVSSGSNHIDEIKSILADYKYKFNFKIANCIDDHPLVIEHIIKQANKLSTNPKDEALLLIGHGSLKETNYIIWETIFNNLIRELRQKTYYNKIDFATFLPNTISGKLNESSENKTIVIPLFLSNGLYTDKKIPDIISDFNTAYNGITYINGNWLSKWIENKIEIFKKER